MATSSPLMLSSSSFSLILSRPKNESIPSVSANPFKAHRPLWNRAGHGRRSAVAAVVLPRAGLRGDVLHLPFLLPGEVYCGDECRRRMRRRQRRRANWRYQQSREGRLDHRDRQRAYRERCRRRRVTDHTSPVVPGQATSRSHYRKRESARHCRRWPMIGPDFSGSKPPSGPFARTRSRDRSDSRDRRHQSGAV